MEKKCLVIMPSRDSEGYAPGHFNRVYQYIIAPACKTAGFTPVKPEDFTSHESSLDMVRTLVDIDIVICDLSAKNTNALYGFAVRQGIGLPVVLIQDMKTKLVIPEGNVEYDDSLRIDTVEKEIETLSKALNAALEGKSGSNPLLSRLGIGAVPDLPKFVVAEKAVPVLEPIDETPKKTPLPVISPLPDYVGEPITAEEIEKLKIGDSLFHMNYGKGEIRTIKKSGRDKMADLLFGSEAKMLLLVTTGVFRKIKA